MCLKFFLIHKRDGKKLIKYGVKLNIGFSRCTQHYMHTIYILLFTMYSVSSWEGSSLSWHLKNRRFLFPQAMHKDECVGAIVCKLDIHRKVIKRGYIAMLAVDVKYRKRKIGSNLVRRAIRAMVEDDADEVVLETEITNRPALRLYENLGFVRDKRLFRYYLNGVDALRLKLWLRWNPSACSCQ